MVTKNIKKILLNKNGNNFVANIEDIENRITQNSSNLETAKQELSNKCNEALNEAKAYTDTEKAKYLPLTGGTVTGLLNCTASNATNADNATNLGGYPATDYIRSVNGINADENGNIQLGNLGNSGAITGEIKWFAFNTPPEGYLVCNGAKVSRETYADLFAVIGTTFGSGDGSTTFTLPNLIDKFAQGSTTVGTVKSAGLPNITGSINLGMCGAYSPSGAFSFTSVSSPCFANGTTGYDVKLFLNASRSSQIYGNSSTVQPPALTLLPCIKY